MISFVFCLYEALLLLHKHFMNGLRFKIICYLLGYCGALVPGYAQTEKIDELQLKAALLVKMFDFIEWPALHRPRDNVFLIGVYQDTEVLHVLQKSYAERMAKARGIEVVPIRDEHDMLHVPFDVIWLGRLSDARLQDILPYIQQSSALIVSDTPGYAQKISMVNFFESEGKVKFEINTRILTQKGFVANFRLLKLAKVVK